jgi:ABC-type amino acid transport substrate-binding protein
MKQGFFKILLLLIVGFLCAGYLLYTIYIRETTKKNLFSLKQSTDSSLENVRQSGVLKIAVNAEYAPMESLDNEGNMVGFDIDLIKEIAKRMNVKAEIYNVSWDEVMEKSKKGESDVSISSISITPERSKELTFSAPYFNGGQVILVSASNNVIKNPGDLRGKLVGFQENTTNEEIAKQYTDTPNLRPYKNIDPMAMDLKNGKLDAVLIDYIAGLFMTKNFLGVKMPSKPFNDEFYGIATKLGNDSLITEINNILRDLKTEGYLQELNRKWLD